MGKEPHQIREEIERTRMELDRDLDALADKVSPRQAVGRRVERARTRMGELRERVMGSASETAGEVSGMARSTPEALQQKARGNPLAAGVLAFGAGWLASSLLPPSRAEVQAAQTIRDKAQEPAGRLGEEVKQAAQDVTESMREPVSQAAQDVTETSRESARHVSEEARSGGSPR